MPELVLIRGPFGAGKSTHAERIFVPRGYVHYEEDLFFYNRGGGRRYAYDPSLRMVAKKWCRDQVYMALAAGRNVVVSNCFPNAGSVAPYRALSKALKADLTIITLQTRFESIHVKDPKLIAAMNLRWQEVI